MLLALDIGNTNLVGGLFDGNNLRSTFRLATERSKTVDEHAILLADMLRLKGIDANRIQSAILASVVPQATSRVAQAVELVVAQKPLIVGGPGLKTGLRINHDNPREVGADRIVNAIAAHEKVKGEVIVVDFGTGTTFDCINSAGEYVGGVIVPGVQVSLDGLLLRAAKLARVEIAEPEHIIGRSTEAALQSGVVYGYASLVDGLVRKIRRELGGNSAILATGGLAKQICKHCEEPMEICPNLTLEGLRLIYERNRGSKR
ncbi:MAG: type III pantothenate kinase [Polyangiaceae bacterium]|nr:type III pantothenate kinase [Polyangiaceae bacterium]